MKTAQAVLRQGVERVVVMVLKKTKRSQRQSLGLVVFKYPEGITSEVKTKLGASHFHDSKESSSGQKTKLAASPFQDYKERQAVPR
jgi:hypothetical protein